MQLPPYIQQTILETDRLLLKEVNPEIIDHIFTQWSDEEIMSYIGLQTPEELAVDKAKQQGGYTTYRIHMRGFLFTSKETNEVVGAAHYHNWQPTHCRSEIGYAIYRDENKNKGYMKEGINAMLDYGFNEMGLNRVEALIGPTNEPSLRLVQGLGFVKEGVLRQHYCKDNALQDSIIFSLLRKDYKQ